MEPIITANLPGPACPLSNGGFVSFLFPHSDGPGDKDRPGLAIHVDVATGEAAPAYGASIFPARLAEFSLRVTDVPNPGLLNLVKPTRLRRLHFVFGLMP